MGRPVIIMHATEQSVLRDLLVKNRKFAVGKRGAPVVSKAIALTLGRGEAGGRVCTPNKFASF